MNIIDIAILVPVCWGAFIGFKKGLIIEVASIVAMLLAVFGAYKLSPRLSPVVLSMLDVSEAAAGLVAFGILFIIIVILVHFLAKGLEKVVKAVALGTFNRIAGACFGAIKFLVICGLVLFFIDRIDAKTSLIKNDFKEGSLLYQPVVGMQQQIFSELLAENDETSAIKKGDE